MQIYERIGNSSQKPDKELKTTPPPTKKKEKRHMKYSGDTKRHNSVYKNLAGGETE